jgi:Sulfotransferase family
MNRTYFRLSELTVVMLLALVFTQGVNTISKLYLQDAKDTLDLRLLATEKAGSGRITNQATSTTNYSENNDNNNENGRNSKIAMTAKEKYYYRQPDVPNSDPDDFHGVKARAFQPWSGDDIPCFEPEVQWRDYDTQMKPTRTGLVFIKTFKTGSSTASGISLRIARNAARRQGKAFEICKSRHDHAWAGSLVGQNRVKPESFLWTIVRDPTSRVLSQFFHFHVSRHKNNSTDASAIAYIQDTFASMSQQYYMNQLSTVTHVVGKSDPVQTANSILEEYDFVAVTERFDESAVVLAMLLNIPIADVLYLTAKGNGGFDDAGGKGGALGCTYITPSFLSEGMKEYFRSDEWQERVHWDHVFYQAANRSLDLTIESLGRDKVEKNLAKYRHAKDRANEVCLPKTTFPCSAKGELNRETDCLWKDSACGSDCLDEISAELNLWANNSPSTTESAK